MVYQGKPSTGCKNCRTRRIKCDEARPHCKACLKTGRLCPGYLHPFDVVLRDHTSSFTKKSVASAVISSSRSNSCSSKDGDAGSEVSSTKSLSPAVSDRSHGSWPVYLPPADLYQPMEDTVIPLFFNSYLYLPKDPHIRNGFMEILPTFYSNASIGSHLHTSTLAVAYFTVAAWTGQESLLRASHRYFTQALPKIRETLLSSNDNEYGNLLMSILMLSIYEEFVAMKDWKRPVKAHLKGAVALVNSRRPEKLQDSSSSSTLHNAVQAQIIKTTRGLETPMVPIPETWPLSPPNTTPSPRMFLSTAASEIVSLRQSWEKLISQEHNETDIISLIDRATKIDLNLVSWTYRVPENWTFVPASIIPQSVRDAGLYRNYCDCYSDMWIASTWNSYRDCRILVQSIMLSCLRLLPTHDSDGSKSAAIQSTINKMADEVCASVPYYLGSQVECVRLQQGLIAYPFSETRPVTSTHKQSAPLMGPWHILPILRNLHSSDLRLPPEQTIWVEKQVNRAMLIYFQR